MSDKKLDLIIEVVSDIKVRQEGLEKIVGEIAVKVDGLKAKFNRLEQEILFARSDLVQIRPKMQKLETCLTEFEDNFKR